MVASGKGLQLNEEIAGVCLSDAAAELETRTSGIRFNLGGGLEDGFYLPQEAVRFGE